MKYSVLIVEDDESLRKMYEFKFIREGYDIITAKNGFEGFEKAEKFRPHLILLDLRMPIMSGDELLEKIRSLPWGNDIKVIVLTNISRREAPMSLSFLNVSRYVVKAHTTPSQVLEIVEEVLRLPKK